MSNRLKDRDIPISKFLENLQREFLMNDFRRKIYPSPSDKRYHKKVMEHKKDKIQDISNRTNLPNIFDSKKVNDEIFSTLFDSNNQPLFELNDKDIRFYYDSGSEFLVYPDKQIASIVSIDLEKEEAILKSKEGSITSSLSEISRIL